MSCLKGLALLALALLGTFELCTSAQERNPSLPFRHFQIDHRRINTVALSPDGKLLVAGGMHGEVYLCDPSQGRIIRTWRSRPMDDITAVGFASSETILAASSDGPVRFFSRTGAELRTAMQCSDACLAIQNGQLLTLRKQTGRIALLDLETGATDPIPAPGCETACLSPDGKFLLGAGRAGDKLDFFVVDLAAKQAKSSWSESGIAASGRHRISHGQRYISALALSSGGRFAATAFEDGSILVRETAAHLDWRLPNRRSGPVSCLIFTPSERQLLYVTEGFLHVESLRARDESGVASSRLDAQTLERLWKDLSHKESGRALEAVWALADGPAKSVPFLEERLRNLPVASDQRTYKELIAALDDNQFKVRRAAFRELQERGTEAVPALQAVLKDPFSPEVRRRAEELLDELQMPTCPPERLAPLRGIMALEYAATPTAFEALIRLSRAAPAQWLQEEARTAAELLERRLKTN
jgi:HEAT repeats